MKNHYQTLGLEPNCTNEQIKSAFREYAKHYHPDKQQGNPFFEEKFKEIKEAYDTLIDSEKRRTHDEFHNINTSYSRKQQTYSDNIQTVATYKSQRQEYQDRLSSEIIRCKIVDSGRITYCLLNNKKERITEEYDDIYGFTVNAWIRVKKNGKHGFIKININKVDKVIPCVFEQAEDFKIAENGIIHINNRKLYYYLNNEKNHLFIDKYAMVLYKNIYCILSEEGEWYDVSKFQEFQEYQKDQKKFRRNVKIEKIKNIFKVILLLVMAAGIIWVSIWIWTPHDILLLWTIIFINLVGTAPLLALSILGMINRDFLG